VLKKNELSDQPDIWKKFFKKSEFIRFWNVILEKFQENLKKKILSGS